MNLDHYAQQEQLNALSAPHRTLRAFMSALEHWQIVVGLLLLVILANLYGCSSVETYADEPRLTITRETDTDYSCVRVKWQTAAEIKADCKQDARACIIDRAVIHTQKPTGRNDWHALYALGHEFYHSLGAGHEETRK